MISVLAMWDKARSIIQPKHIWWLLVIIGVFQRFRQYIANRSLWADEASLALNIVERTFAGLTAPLDSNQGAPIGFLWIEKLFVTVLGNKDYVLRLVPLLCGIASVYLLYKVASEFGGHFGLFSLLMFNLSWTLIYYSSEVKQYGVDVAVALFIVFYSLRVVPGNANRSDFVGLAAVGFAAMWLSHPSVFLLAGVGILLMYSRLNKRSSYPVGWLLAIGTAWVVNLWIIYRISIQQLSGNDYLQQFWGHAFMPLPPWEHWNWLADAYLKLLSVSTGIFRPLPWHFVLPCSIAVLFGLIPAERSGNQFLLRLTVIAVLLMLIVSAFGLYPVQGRFLLFLAPFLFLLMANGLMQIHRLIGRWSVPTAHVVSLILILGMSWKPARLAAENLIVPPMGEHIKPALAYIQENRMDSDIIYVYYGGQVAFDYYRDTFGLGSANVINGVMSREEPKVYLQDINRLRGHNRVWFVFTHNCDTCVVHEQRYFIQNLNKIGTLISRLHAPGANLYLYDLTP